MTGYNRPFVDTAPFIYYLENQPKYYESARGFFSQCIKEKISVVTSVVTIEEYLVHPYREGKQDIIDNFYGFINALNIQIVDIDQRIADRAAEIRAKYIGFKGMDALQLACAVVSGCDLILTNDIQLRQFEEVPCILLDELEKAQKKHTN